MSLIFYKTRSTLFVRQCDQMVVFIGNLGSKTLRCHISLTIYCKTHVMYHPWQINLMISNEGASIRWLLMRAFSEMIQIRSLSVFLSIYFPIIYSEAINFDWHNGWKYWTLASKNVREEESNTRLEKWRAT